MVQGFAAGRTAAFIAQAVLDATQEAVAVRTVARRAAEWRCEVDRRKLARERMEDLVAAAEKGGIESSGVIRALALEALEANPEALTSAEPLELQGMALKAEMVRIQRLRLEVAARKVAVDEKRVGMLEARERRAVEVLAETGETVSPEERMRRIREIYGIG